MTMISIHEFEKLARLYLVEQLPRLIRQRE